jgi:D-lyxose ketol-isomerase
MKRSEINDYIKDSINVFEKNKFYLPSWAFFSPSDWEQVDQTAYCEIIDNMLGWDITDFDKGDFLQSGLILFTLRNGNLIKDAKPYAEKIMIVREKQITPMHYHANKMEDIINRGGGNLIIEIYGSTKSGELSSKPIELKIDGVLQTVTPGEKIILTPGESVCLEQYVYHSFWGEIGKGNVIVGEVSMVNDDASDNYFYEQQGRFSQIIEDEPINHFLAIDYQKYMTS